MMMYNLEKRKNEMKLTEKISGVADSLGNAIENYDTPLSGAFYKKHFGKMIIVGILLMSYIDLRYEYEDAIYRLGQLKTELDEVRYTSIARWGELTGKNKPEVVRLKVAESDVELIPTDEPPILIK